MAEKIYGQAALNAAKGGGYTIFLAGDASTSNRPTILSIEKAEAWVKKEPKRVFATARGPRISKKKGGEKLPSAASPLGARERPSRKSSRAPSMPAARPPSGMPPRPPMAPPMSRPPMPSMRSPSAPTAPWSSPSMSPRKSRSPKVGGLVAYESMLSMLAHAADRASLGRAWATVDQAHKGGQLNATEYGKLKDIALYMGETFQEGHRPKRAIPSDLKPFLKSHGMVAGSVVAASSVYANPKDPRRSKAPAAPRPLPTPRSPLSEEVGATKAGLQKAVDILKNLRGVVTAAVIGNNTVVVTLEHDSAEMRRRCSAAVSGVYRGSLTFATASGAPRIGENMAEEKKRKKKKKSAQAKKASRKKAAAKKKSAPKKKSAAKKKTVAKAAAPKKKAAKKKKASAKKSTRKTSAKKSAKRAAPKKKASRKRKSGAKKTTSRKAAPKAAPKKKATRKRSAKKKSAAKKSGPFVAALKKSGKYFVAVVKDGSKFCGCRYGHIVSHNTILNDYKENPGQFMPCTMAVTK